MGKIKTIEDYEAEFKKLHAEGKEPSYSQKSKWADLVSIVVFQSQQEWYPWTEEELGYPVRKMLKKKDTKREKVPAQTGDYIAFYNTPSGSGWIPFVVERKGGKEGKSGPHDLYSSLSNIENRTNIYEEIERAVVDERFERMFLIAECSYKDYCSYVPVFSGRDGNGHAKRNTNHISMSVASREATIAGLYIRGCNVVFAGTRDKAVKMYQDLNRMWLLRNYTKVLKLDQVQYNDLKALSEKKARLEVELQALNASLSRLEEVDA